jgi:hypothetical protein
MTQFRGSHAGANMGQDETDLARFATRHRCLRQHSNSATSEVTRKAAASGIAQAIRVGPNVH